MSKKILVFLGVLILIIMAWLWTPNTDFDQTFDKYAKSDSQLISLANGQRLHYREFGQNNGPALILIHGTSDSLLTWDPLTDELDSKWRIISMDLPGHGFSGQQPQNDYSIAKFVETVIALMDQLDVPQAVVAGNSLGGGIAWQLALKAPQRVNSLVLLNPSGAPRSKEPKSNIGFKLLQSSVGQFFGRRMTPRPLIEKSLAGSVTDASLATPELVDRYWELLRLPGNREALITMANRPRNDEQWQKINQVSAPALIVWGRDDQIISVESAEKFAEKLPNNQLIIYEDIAHLPMLENPQRLAADMQLFLANLNN